MSSFGVLMPGFAHIVKLLLMYRESKEITTE